MMVFYPVPFGVINIELGNGKPKPFEMKTALGIAISQFPNPHNPDASPREKDSHTSAPLAQAQAKGPMHSMHQKHIE